MSALRPITDATGIDRPQILDDLLANVQDEPFVLAQIVVAPTASQASADAADGVVGRAGANGVTINLLPGIAATLEDLGLGIAPSAEPLVSVKLGQSYAEVVRDPVTGAAKADASAAQLLSIDVNDTLGILQELTGQPTGVHDTLAVVIGRAHV